MHELSNKIKIKKIEDNTAENVEIAITLPAKVSPDKTIDALYSFTDCEVSISPLSCVIEEETPKFLGVSEILYISTNRTLDLLKQELEVVLNEMQEKWHFASLERIFIENRIYHQIEELESWEEVISTIHKGLKPHTKNLLREVIDEDVSRLTEIKIKRITKFDLDKAKNDILKLEERIKEVKHNLNNLTDYAIAYFKKLKKDYGKEFKRKTEIKTFENIEAKKVVVASKKLYVNRKEGFIGTTLRKDEYVCDCSDIDDIIAFKKDGSMIKTKVDDKTFVGKDIIHCGVFKKGDERTIYNMIYKDGKSGNTMIKRFAVKGITRNKEYTLTKTNKGSKVLYFTANPNGQAEQVTIHLRALQRLKKLKIDVDFSKITIKGRSANGNIITKNTVKKVELKSEGISTLSARKIWFDDAVQRLNVDKRGEFLGAFEAEDKILTINQQGDLQLKGFELSTHFDEDIIVIEKFNPAKPISAIYFDGKKECYFVKRFKVEVKSKKLNFITQHKNSFLEIASTDWRPQAKVVFVKEKGKQRKTVIINMEEFITLKGVKAIGNKLSNNKIKEINLLEALPSEEEKLEETKQEIEIIESENISEKREDNDNKQISLDL